MEKNLPCETGSLPGFGSAMEQSSRLKMVETFPSLRVAEDTSRDKAVPRLFQASKLS